MAYTVINFLSDQLKASAPDAEWDAAGIDRAAELAGVLQLRGIRDLSKLQLAKVTTQKQAFKWSDPYWVDDFVFLYEGKQLGFLGNVGENNTEPYLQQINGAVLASWSAHGHGHVAYLLQPRATGFVIVPSWGSSSDADFARGAIKFYVTFIIAFVLPAAGIAAGATVGTAIVGAQFAAAYPVLTAAIGNAAIGAAMSGGSVEDAVKGAALAYVGGTIGAQVGGFVADQTNLDLLGKVSASVTSTFVRGGDIEDAARDALLRNVGDTLTIFQPSTQGVPMFDADYTFGNSLLDFGAQPAYDLSFSNVGPALTFDNPNLPNFDFTFDLTTAQPDFAVPVWNTLPGGPAPTGEFDLAMNPFPVGGDTAPPTFSNVGTPYLPSTPVTESPRAMPQGDGFSLNDARNIVNNISAMALQALAVTQAYQAARNPSVNTAARTVNNGTVRSVLDNGVIMTRDPAGRVTYTRPATGVPQSTVNGNLVINNGDGTYTLIDANGNRRVIAYGPETPASTNPVSNLLGNFSLDNINWPLVTGGLGVVVLLMKARGRK